LTIMDLWRRTMAMVSRWNESLTHRNIVVKNEAGYHLDKDHDPDRALERIRTTGSLSISPELFEKIYLSPQNRVAGDLRKTFGNPTPL